MPPESSDPPDLTLHEAAERLGVHYNTAYRYVRRGRLRARRVSGEWRIDPNDLETVGAPTSGVRGAPDWPGHRTRLRERLVVGDLEGSWSVVSDVLDSGAVATDVHTELIGPTMRTIGEEWASGRLRIEDEHRATAVVMMLLGRLSSQTTRRGRRKGSVVLGAAPNDRHALPVSMMADLLRAAGFAAVDLGADVPAASFARSVTGDDELLGLALFAGVPGNDDAVASVFAAVRPVRPPTAVMIAGGSGIDDADHARRLGADALGDSPAAVIDLLDDAATRRRQAR